MTTILLYLVAVCYSGPWTGQPATGHQTTQHATGSTQRKTVL